MEKSKGTVFITGITGFIGSQVCKECLERGYKVIGVVRDFSNQNKMKTMNNMPFKDNLTLVRADLMDPLHWWIYIMKGSDYVIHVATPVTLSQVKDENIIIKPAVEGTLSVMKAASYHKVKSVVVTGSMSSLIDFSKIKDLKSLSETSGKTVVDPKNSSIPYQKSKILAENAAWEFYKNLPIYSKFRFTMILPGLVLGPTLLYERFSSDRFIYNYLTSKFPITFDFGNPISDVRDVALAHVLAMEKEISDGKRYIISGETMLFTEIAQIVRSEMIKHGYKVRSFSIPYCILKLGTLCSQKYRNLLKLFYKAKYTISCTEIQQDLGINLRNPKEAIISMAYSLIANGIVNSKIKIIKNE